jgi:hypothetical protein
MPRPQPPLTATDVDEMLHTFLNGDPVDAREAFETFHRTPEARAAKRTKQSERAWALTMCHGVHHFKIDNVLERFWKAPKYAMGKSNAIRINYLWRILRAWGPPFWAQLAEKSVHLPQEPNAHLLSGLATVADDECFDLDEFATEFTKWRSPQTPRNPEYELQNPAASQQRLVCERDVKYFLEWAKGPHGVRHTRAQQASARDKREARTKRVRRSRALPSATVEIDTIDAILDGEDTPSETTPRISKIERVSSEELDQPAEPAVESPRKKRPRPSNKDSSTPKRPRKNRKSIDVPKQESESEDMDTHVESSTRDNTRCETPFTELGDMDRFTSNGPLVSPFKVLASYSKRLGTLRERVSRFASDLSRAISSHGIVRKRIGEQNLPQNSDEIKSRIIHLQGELLHCKNWEVWLKSCPPSLSATVPHHMSSDDPLAKAAQPVHELKETTTARAANLNAQIQLYEKTLMELEKADAAWNAAFDAKDLAQRELKSEEDIWENFLGAAMGLYERPVGPGGRREQMLALTTGEEPQTNDNDSVMG